MKELNLTTNLTNEEWQKVKEIINNTEWVHQRVNFELSQGKDWNLVMYQVAKAFNIISE